MVGTRPMVRPPALCRAAADFMAATEEMTLTAASFSTAARRAGPCFPRQAGGRNELPPETLRSRHPRERAAPPLRVQGSTQNLARLLPALPTDLEPAEMVDGLGRQADMSQ